MCGSTGHHSTSSPDKNDMILTLMEFRGDGIESDSASEAWTNAIDGEGLWHVSDDVFTLFCVMEEEIRCHLTVTTTRTGPHEGLKEIFDGLARSDDVQFQWYVLSAELDTATADRLRDMIVELYVTICRFAFANSCLELYKKSQRKTTQ